MTDDGYVYGVGFAIGSIIMIIWILLVALFGC